MARLEALSRRSLSDRIAEVLLDYIVDEDLHEGDSLPSTAELAERFGVSRTVIREALAVLGGRGVLQRNQGKESVVARPGTDSLTRVLQFQLRQPTPLDTADVFECRFALEVSAAGSAARKANGDDIAVLRTKLAELRAATKEDDFHVADIELHRAIVLASGSDLILLILDSLVEIMRELRVTATRNRFARGHGHGFDEAIEEHAAIVEAIAAHDAEAAERAMKLHLETTRREYESKPPA